MAHLHHVRQGSTRELSQERLAGPDQARGWDDFGCNHTKSTSRLVTQLTSRSSRARFAVSDRTGPQRAGRLNSGVRSCQRKFSAQEQLNQATRPLLGAATLAPHPFLFPRPLIAFGSFNSGTPDFIRRCRCGVSLRSLASRGSPAGARGNKPCRAYLPASVRFLRVQGLDCR